MGAEPQVIIIAGPNGAGKSTLAPILLRDTFGLRDYVNADPIALGLSGFDPASMAFEAGRIMLKRLHALAEQRKNFAFESERPAARSYAGWIETLIANDYKFELVFLWLRSAELAVQRVRERVRSGGHDVPEKVIRRMPPERKTSGHFTCLWPTHGLCTIIPQRLGRCRLLQEVRVAT